MRSILVILLILTTTSAFAQRGRRNKQTTPPPKTRPDWVVSNEDALKLRARGDFDQAIVRAKEGMEQAASVYGTSSKAYRRVATTLAGIYKEMGEFEAAEALGYGLTWEEMSQKGIESYFAGNYDKASLWAYKALKKVEGEYGTYHGSYALCLANMADAYRMQGRYQEADSLLKEAAARIRAVYGERHSMYAKTMINHAFLFGAMGEAKKAELRFTEAKAFLTKTLGASDPVVLEVGDHLAHSYQLMGDYPKAQKEYQAFRDLRKAENGENSPEYVQSMYKLAQLYAVSENFPLAEQQLLEVISLGEHVLGGLHPDYIGAVVDLAMVHTAQQRYPKADSVFQKAFSLLKDRLTGDMVLMSENERLQYMERPQKVLDAYFSMLQQAHKDHPELVANGYNQWLQWKGWLITTYPSMMLGYDAGGTTKWSDIKFGLDPDHAAIEIVRYRYFSTHWTDSIRYAALVIKRESDYPAWHTIPYGNDLETKLLTYYNATKQAPSALIYQKFWEPIMEDLKLVRKVFLSTDGVYNQINLAALPVPGEVGAYLSDLLEFHRVSSTRYMGARMGGPNPTTHAMLMGPPAYDMAIASNDNVAPGSGPFYNFWQSDLETMTLKGVNWTQQSEAAQEMLAMEKWFAEMEWTSKQIEAQAACEDSLKTMQGPTVLHWSSGTLVLFPQLEYDSLVYRRYIGLPDARFKPTRVNPELRSGIALTGAKKVLGTTVPGKRNDGILTNLEIISLPLNNTEVVVLPPHQQKNNAVIGRSLFGLLRAFEIAGAKTFIITHWEVPMEARVSFFQTFYDEWLFYEKSKREAFTEALAALRKDYPSPAVWGAFEILGE